MSYTDCNEHVGFLVLRDEELSKVFDSDLNVRKKIYVDAICNEMSNKFGCAFHCGGNNAGKVIVSFKLYCIARPEKKFILKYSKGISENKFDIYTNELTPCESHKETPAGRNISSSERDKLKQELMKHKPIDVILINV